jgi:hypothetical protein
MKFEFPEINKVCFETESIASANGGAGDKPNVTLYDDNNASNAVI